MLVDWRRQKIPLIELYGMWEWLPATSAVKTRLAGIVDDRRWSDGEWMQAAQTTYLQTLLQVAWVGFRLTGDVPTFSPVRTPRTREDVAAERLAAAAAAEAERVQAARMDYLRTLRPPPGTHNLRPTLGR
ncbi:hypothetical protein ACQEU6_08600 [Spirillospora sp. CA-108201]